MNSYTSQRSIESPLCNDASNAITVPNHNDIYDFAPALRIFLCDEQRAI